MKKAAIKKAVEKQTAKHLKDAIDSHARSKAYGQVADAMVEGSPAEEASESPTEEVNEASETMAQRTTGMSPHDAMTAAMAGRKGRS